MTPERFQQIEQLYHAARKATAGQRAALLAQADPGLRRAVESLLAEHSGGELLDRPAIQNGAPLLEDATLTAVTAGTRLGPYRIVGKLGQGGMGEVFRAVDTRLGRTVAIKTTREQFSVRFEREARAIASLNHPHICTLYDVGPNYLVMELVEGETLAALLQRGPLPVKTAVLYASQIVGALVEAQAKGIVHRDLKPGNVMVGKSGIKVLDFGLARMRQDETVTVSHVVVGTPAYMAPEQRGGKPADARSDIYAFGCVLYEMLTGSRITSQRRRIPSRRLERIITRCLEEDPGRRWQSAAGLQRELAAVTLPRRSTRMAAGAAAILVLAAGAYFSFHRAPKLAAKDTIVLAEFENRTGDPVFDQTLRQALSVQLQQSPFLLLASDERIKKSLRMMNRPVATRLTPEVSREICERIGGSAVLEGSIAGFGSQYILWLKARNCRTGESLAEEQAQAEGKEEVLKALSRIATQMRTQLGESLASVQEYSKPLEQATTSSLEALQAYSAAKVAMFTRGAPASIPHLQQAIAIDPQFAMAHADLGFMSWNMGQTDLGAEEVRIAYALRDRVSDRERRFIVMLYDRQVTGNLQKELQTLESWAQTYPRDAYAHGIIAGWVSFGTGNYERGIQASQVAMRLDPDIPFPYAGAAYHNILLNRFTQAAEALQLAAERKLEVPEFLINRYYLAFLKGDQAGMDREIARAPGEHVEDWLSHNQALVFARSGRMREARSMWERAVALARQAGKWEAAAIYTAAAAVCEAHFGNKAESRKRARAALELAKGRDVEYAAAFALALSGDPPESHRLAADLAKRFPEDTPVQFEYLPTLEALSALARWAPLDAIDRLKPAIPYDFALPGTAFFAKFGGLYPAYVRGRAYLEAARGREAAAEFQKVLDHRGIVLADPVGALAHLQLGRALALLGEKDKARNAYQEFLALWKDADPDIPVLKQAGAEYAKL
jgi:tetratricopeptide (TPR) repeat protein/predicted Ser/Thr protein kinase